MRKRQFFLREIGLWRREEKTCTLLLTEYTKKNPKKQPFPSILIHSISLHVNVWADPLAPSPDIINEIINFINWETEILDFPFLIIQGYLHPFSQTVRSM